MPIAVRLALAFRFLFLFGIARPDESVGMTPISVYDFIDAHQSHNSVPQKTSFGLHYQAKIRL